MTLATTLLAVADIERSKRFYEEMFGQRVTRDLGGHVAFSGGFAIQQDFARLTGLPAGSVVCRAHNMELYFEVEDFDTFTARLRRRSDVAYVHPPRTYPWMQRVVRIYDPDGHLIEIGESRAVIARRLYTEGHTPAEIARCMHCPVDDIEALIER